MALYEFINPSDDYSFEAPDDDVASTLVLFVSDQCGWRCGERSAFFLSTDPESDEGKALMEMAKSVVTDRTAELVAALRTFEIKGDQRRRLGVDPDEWHDEMRSSAADFRAEALRLADSFERRLA